MEVNLFAISTGNSGEALIVENILFSFYKSTACSAFEKMSYLKLMLCSFLKND